LSSLYQDYSQGDVQRGSFPKPRSLESITKCHRQLRAHLCSAAPSLEVALICSIIFFAFESLVGDTQQAIWHLDQGLKLWQRHQENFSPFAPSSDDLFCHLGFELSRLDTHVSTLKDDRSPVLTLTSSAERTGSVPIVPDIFLEIMRAENVLVRLQNWTIHLLIRLVQYKLESPEWLSSNIAREICILEAQYDRFKTAINNLLSKSSFASSSQILLLRLQTQIYHSVLLERTSNLFISSRYGVEDNLRGAISDMTLLLSGFSDAQFQRHTFTLSTQLVSGICFACLKTTDRKTLEQGLELLRHPRFPCRDGVWDVEVVGSVIQAIVERENPPDKDGHVLTQSLEALGSDILEAAAGLDVTFGDLRRSKSAMLLA
jgi:hypothetical protein